MAFRIGIVLWLFITSNALSDTLGAEAIILTTHVQGQRDAPIEYYRRQLDSEGRNIFTPGVEVYYETSLQRPFLHSEKLRFVGGLLKDSIDHRFGYVAILGHYSLYQGEDLGIEFHIGPGLIARESWRSVPNYDPDNPMKESDRFLPGYEYRFLPLGEIDIVFPLSESKELVWSVFPGVPYVVMQSFGLRWTF